MNQQANFNLYSCYYDAFYNDKNYSQESAAAVNLIREFSPSAKTILELGCGTGNHANFLVEGGFHITGVERSEEMVALAKGKAITNFEPIISDIRDFDLKRNFDVALSLFHVISYLTSNTDLISCFTCVNHHLTKGGLFIFDAWYSPAIYHQHPETRIKRKTLGGFELTRLAEPMHFTDRNVVDVNYEIIIRNKETDITQVVNEKHSMRYFSIPEIELLAQLTGFQLMFVQELLSGQKPSANTWASCFVLKKNRDVQYTC
ncbi:MAG: class I SAM-dependent methyltransferase [Sphingobacteriales bacterium]|nr:MAG: class I SAM-dependent methyltransferase [Sphingobacteriales bacterium]